MKKQNEIDALIASLEKEAPKSCSKPKSDMCSKCIDRVFSDKAVKINKYVKELKDIKAIRGVLPASLETKIIDILKSE